MSEKKSGRDKRGRSVLARCVVICIVAAFIGSSGIPMPALAVVHAEDTVKVTVNAPEYVEGTFDATIDVDSITGINSAQFDLSFDSSMVDVTDVKEGEIGGEAVPIFMWDFVDADTIRVLVSMPMEVGVNGSGYLAEVEFEVKGEDGDKSKLDISNGMLVDTKAREIEADWYDAEVAVVAPEPLFAETASDTSGIYIFENLPAGDYAVIAFQDHPFAGWIIGRVNVTVGDSPLSDVNMSLVQADEKGIEEIEEIQNKTVNPEGTGSGSISGTLHATSPFGEVTVSGATVVLIKEKAVGIGVSVTVNAPEVVSDTFTARIDIENVVDMNSAQFDLSFDSSVVDVTDVKEGEIGGETVPIFMWSFIDADTIRVLVSMPMEVGVNGSGYLAEVEFEVKGKSGDKSKLDIFNGMLVDTEAREIEADWYDDEITVLRAVVSVDAPEYVSGAFNAVIGIDDVTDLNSAQFDLSFDSRVVDVTDVKDGEIDGEVVPILMWSFVDADTIRVLVSMPMEVGVNGSGYLAEVEFEVTGKSGDKSKLDISNGMLVDTEAKEIDANWYDTEVTVVAPATLFAQTTSDGSGNYSFENLPAGNYTVTAFQDNPFAGWIIGRVNVTVGDSLLSDVNISLTKADEREIEEINELLTRTISPEGTGSGAVSGTLHATSPFGEVTVSGATVVLIKEKAAGIGVSVTVNAPEVVSGTFTARIDIENIVDMNSGQFDLSFNSSVVNVTYVKDGKIDGETVPLFMWNFVDADTVRVLVSMPMEVGVSGSGYLAEIEFEVKGEDGDRSVLDISDGLLVNTEAGEIETYWYGDKVTVKVPH